MRRILIGLALALVVLPAWAQTRNENVARCNGNDLDLIISGCTAMIQSGQETTAMLAVALNNRGSAYDDKGLTYQAIADYTKAIALKPDFNLAYANRGTAYAKQGRRDRAISDYRAALKLDPKDDGSRQGLKELGVAP